MSAGGSEGLRAGVEAWLASKPTGGRGSHGMAVGWTFGYLDAQDDLRALLAAQSGPEVVGATVVDDLWQCGDCGRDDTGPLAAHRHRNPTPAEPRGDAAGLEAVLLTHGFYQCPGVGQGWFCECGASLRDFWPKGDVTKRDTALHYAHRAHLAAVIVEAGWKR